MFLGASSLLEEIGFPRLQLWENGKMYDHHNQRERLPQRDGSIDMISPVTGKLTVIHLNETFISNIETGLCDGDIIMDPI